MKVKKYAEVAHSLAVGGFQALTLDAIDVTLGCEAAVCYVQVLHFCQSHHASLEANPAGPRRNPEST